MAPYHILIVIISSVIPENLVLLTKSEQSRPKSAQIRPTNFFVIEKQSREEEMQPIKKIYIFRVLCSRHARKMKFRSVAHKLQKCKR